jgi:hypothetical protein
LTTPKLSIVVIFHRMSRQAENTLRSLTVPYQRNVQEDDYEIIVVENASDDPLGEARALALGGNVRYFYRDEPGVSPVPAVNFGFDQCRAPLFGLIIDGARLVTPRLVEHALLGARLSEHPLIVVPGYHLGKEEHHKHVASGYGEEREKALLLEIGWPEDGYRLFEIACFSGANSRGFLTQFLESNCLFCKRESFEKIGKADPRFTLPGGGSVNIYVYHALARLPECRLIVLAGEGSFHQFHGGVTTMEVEDREAMLQTHRDNLAEVFGGPFKGMHREPLVLGTLPGPVHPFLKASSAQAAAQYAICKSKGLTQWQKPE